MNNVSRVKVIGSSQKLVHKILHVFVRKLLSRVNNSVHVSLHQLCDNVDVLEASLSWRL
jgi:hypothetical protein